jgi:hypothetical protein
MIHFKEVICVESTIRAIRNKKCASIAIWLYKQIRFTYSGIPESDVSFSVTG